jgi:SAM-dependent methyltransferase
VTTIRECVGRSGSRPQGATFLRAPDVNRDFYDTLWHETRLVTPDRFNTWPVVGTLAAERGARLEIGAGLRPRLPLDDTVFVDSSRHAVATLAGRGCHALVGDLSRLPFPERSFALVAAFDVIEHVEDDACVFRELARVLASDGVLVCSVPLHRSGWTEFDTMVGHCRRYEPPEFAARLAEHGLRVVESAVFGMQPKKGALLDFGTWCLKHWHGFAMRWYNWCLPITLRFQKPLRFVPGLVADPDVDEIVAVCRH